MKGTSDRSDQTEPELSVLLPCRNEEEGLGLCIETILAVFERHHIQGEIIVSDSSSDESPRIAKRYGVRLVKHDKKGYGRAYVEAIKHVQARFVFMADPDGSYDFAEIPRFMHALKNGADLVIGNRMHGDIHRGAMPWHHRYIGNPLFRYVLKLWFHVDIYDLHSGMRALRRDTLEQLHLTSPGMEFASEMIIKALRHKLVIHEIPIDYHLRLGQSKLRSFADGWRHLWLLYSYSPVPYVVYSCAIVFLSVVVMRMYFR